MSVSRYGIKSRDRLDLARFGTKLIIIYQLYYIGLGKFAFHHELFSTPMFRLVSAACYVMPCVAVDLIKKFLNFCRVGPEITNTDILLNKRPTQTRDNGQDVSEMTASLSVAFRFGRIKGARRLLFEEV